jgi:hypothetical protein
MSLHRRLSVAIALFAVGYAAHGAHPPAITAQAGGATDTPVAPRNDPTVAPSPPDKPRAGSPPVVRPPPGAPVPKRRDQGAGRTPDAAPAEDPGAAGRIDESTGPTSGARAKPPEEEHKRVLPNAQEDKDKPGVSTPPESIR